MWAVGSTVYRQVQRGEATFAVPQGKTIDDKSFIFQVCRDSRTGREYFVNRDSHQKRWTLPPLPPQSNQPFRDRLIAFFGSHDPERVENVDVTIEMHKGREDELMQNLIQEYGPEPPFYPAATPRDSHRKRLIAFYRQHNPQKLGDADKILDSFAGKEHVMFRSLCERYGPEPHPDDSIDKEVEARVTAIYEKYNPANLNRVAEVLAHYRDRESQLLKELQDKYGVEPMPGEGDEAPVASNPYRDRAVAIYNAYMPSKAHRVDGELTKNAGNEESYLAALVSKYGPEPPVAPPTSIEASVPAKSTRSLNERVHAIYAKYKPGKPHLAAKALEKYKGQEDVLLTTLIQTYGPEPEDEPAPAVNMIEDNDQGTNSTPMEPSPSHATTAPAPAGETSSGNAPQSSEPKANGLSDDTVNQQSSDNAPPTPDATESAQVVLDEHEVFAHYATSPPNVKQQLLLSFLNDREARLREALNHNQRTASTIAELKASNAELSAEIETVAAKSKVSCRVHEAQVAREREAAEDSLRMWKLEREQLQAQHRMELVAAQRSLNEARLAFEEERARRASELTDLRRRVVAADSDARIMADDSTKLLRALDQRQSECASLRSIIDKLREQAEPKPTANASTQTLASTATRSSLTADFAKGGSLCARCRKIASVQCTACCVALCLQCDKTIHSTNARFALHARQSIGNLHAGRRADQTARLDGPPTMPVSDVVASLDAAMQDQQHSLATLDHYQNLVKQLEDRIRELTEECELLRRTGTAPSVAMEISDRIARQTAAEQEAVHELTQRNRELEQHIAKLELQLLSLPENCEAALDSSELRKEMLMLQNAVVEAQQQARVYKSEIRQLRGRLQVQMSAPLGSRFI